MALIEYRKWQAGRGAMAVIKDGWFLFGFVPIYIRWQTRKGGK